MQTSLETLNRNIEVKEHHCYRVTHCAHEPHVSNVHVNGMSNANFLFVCFVHDVNALKRRQTQIYAMHFPCYTSKFQTKWLLQNVYNDLCVFVCLWLFNGECHGSFKTVMLGICVWKLLLLTFDIARLRYLLLHEYIFFLLLLYFWCIFGQLWSCRTVRQRETSQVDEHTFLALLLLCCKDYSKWINKVAGPRCREAVTFVKSITMKSFFFCVMHIYMRCMRCVSQSGTFMDDEL